jgi:hypothetical protein
MEQLYSKFSQEEEMIQSIGLRALFFAIFQSFTNFLALGLNKKSSISNKSGENLSAFFASPLTTITNFKKAITSLDNQNHIFHFNRIYSVDGLMYHVSVKNLNNYSHNFLMVQKDGHWFFKDIKVTPQWIIELEPQLEAAIQGNL